MVNGQFVVGGAPYGGPSRAASPVASPSASPTVSATSTPAAVAAGVVHGQGFGDTDANGQPGDAETGLAHVEVSITFANGLSRSATTDDSGTFAFEGLAAGTYHVGMTVPGGYVATTDSGQDMEVIQGTDTAEVIFRL